MKPHPLDSLDDEIRDHIERNTQENIERGMTPEEARRAALRKFGSIATVKEDARTVWVPMWLDHLRQDVRYAMRGLLRNPGFAAVAVLTLALGIGATTAIFSVVNAVVLRPLPFPEPERVMIVGEDFEGRGQPSDVSPGNFIDWRTHSTSFSSLGARQDVNFNLAGDDQPERVRGGRVTHSWFDVLRVTPLHGRVFIREEDAPGRDRVVVLSHRLWTRRYAADPQIVGRDIRLNAVAFTVIGVMPAAFDLTVAAEEIWTPIALTPAQLASHDSHELTVIGRLAPDISVDQARAELRTIFGQMQQRFAGDINVNLGLVEPAHDQFVGDYRRRLLVLLGAVTLVLLIACGNVTNLLLARGGSRAREIAMRAAIGASRGRLVRQLLTETMVLAGAGAAVGVGVAWLTVPALIAYSPEGVPRLEQTRVDGPVLAFGLAATLLSAVLAGLAPALRAARTDLRGGLNDGGRAGTSGRDRLRTVLVAVEVASALMLLVGAGLLVRSALHLQRIDLGFNPRGVLTARLTLPAERYAEPERVVQAFNGIVAALAATPGVARASAGTSSPLTAGGNTNGLLPEGKPLDERNFVSARLAIVTDDYFETLGVPLRRGRLFKSDDRRGGLRVAVVNETAARTLFSGADPIGKRFDCCDGTPSSPGWRTIVGVVGDARSRGPVQDAQPEFFLPIAQAPDAAWTWIQRSMTIVARSQTGDGAALSGAARDAVRHVDPTLPLYHVRSMEQQLQSSMAQALLNTRVMLLLGGIGLLLSAIGIYGVIAYFVAQRRQEIAIRMTLGAKAGDVLWMVIRQGMQPVALGIPVGIAGAYGASRLFASYVYGVTTTDPLTFATVATALATVALVATSVPALRATQVAPIVALRCD
jgi:predicted permease